MNYLKKLPLSLTLICTLAAATFGGETNAPPCLPGELQSPPCAAQPLNDDSPVPGETSRTPALPVVSVTDIAETLMWSLLLF